MGVHSSKCLILVKSYESANHHDDRWSNNSMKKYDRRKLPASNLSEVSPKVESDQRKWKVLQILSVAIVKCGASVSLLYVCTKKIWCGLVTDHRRCDQAWMQLTWVSNDVEKARRPSTQHVLASAHDLAPTLAHDPNRCSSSVLPTGSMLHLLPPNEYQKKSNHGYNTY
jgi:hypothetical protein